MRLSKNFKLEVNLIDPLNRKTGFGKIEIREGIITHIEITGPQKEGKPYLMPGFVDAHIHIESSMLTPPAFAGIAVRHGTVATVSDPHEIANVCGIEGVRYMVDLGRQSKFQFYFGAPSCVPATGFETAGANLSAEEIIELFEEGSVSYLSEMMNYPAVLSGNPLVMDKIAAAQRFNFPVDGHAPGLRGKEVKKYASAGISTDHECTSLPEALDKIDAGMHILIREGSAAKNYDALHSLIRTHPHKVMFCSDDKHPDDLLHGHINQLVTRSLARGYDILDVLSIACVNPVLHYRLNTGLLQLGNFADMILVQDLQSFKIASTWIKGYQVFNGTSVDLPEVQIPLIHSFLITPITSEEINLKLVDGVAKIIEVIDGAIATESSMQHMNAGTFQGDTHRDILKMVVVNRYHQSAPAKALIHGFGMRYGAIASSVAHDSHNIVAVGTNDEDLVQCINQVIAHKGGVAACQEGEMHILPLPIAGLMSTADGETVGKAYEHIDHFVKMKLESTLTAPFMTLSFMALLVIPSLKLSDKGLFDSHSFKFTSLQ